MRKVGIFGGRFDPIHIGHLIVAQDAVELLNLEKLVFLVSFTPPHKDCFAPFEDRFEMVKLAISGVPYFEVSDIEKRLRLEKCYTYEVMKKLKVELQGANCLLIIGMDQFNALPTWYRWRDLVELVKIAVLRRPGDTPDPDLTKKLKEKVIFLDTRLIDISSTEIRERIKDGKSIRFLVPQSVKEYIVSKGLYKAQIS